MENKKQETYQYHRFLDEAGDTTFYGKGKIPIIGTNGVSNYFIIGMLTLNEPINEVRKKVISLQEEIAKDPYFIEIPSIIKKRDKMGYFLHAKDDIPEVRKMAFELIKSINCHFDAVIGRKDYGIYEKKHNGKQAEFYADLLSHLLHGGVIKHEKLVLNIAQRSQCTTHTNLQKGLQKAVSIANYKFPNEPNSCQMKFNVQQPTTEPIINIIDYFLWALQRKMERNELRYFNYLDNQIHSVNNLYIEEPKK